MIREVKMDFEFLPYIPKSPVPKEQLHTQACNNDNITISSWRKTWLDNIKANKKKFGNFTDTHIGKFWGTWRNKPAFVLGSGPDLKNNIEQLKDPKGIGIISCLHNFHYCVDHQVPVDFFVTLDAGEVTIPEISEGGSLSHEEYLEKTKNYTLFAYIGSSPKLLEAWRGPIYFFNSPVPDESFMEEQAEASGLHVYVSSGGNVFGAATYIAKGILGSNPIIWLGASFSFSYDNQFHSWNSKYDKDMGQVLRAIDVFGNSRKTWQSYYNFKCWFDWLAQTVPGIYINASEGGILGAYHEGNIAAIQQQTLHQVLRMFSLCDETKAECENPSSNYFDMPEPEVPQVLKQKKVMKILF